MRTIAKLLTSTAMAGLFTMQPAGAAGPAATVVEVVTFTLKPGVSAEEFRKADKDVETQHVAKQPGFFSRESASAADGEWLVIVHWRSTRDADASMASFASAPAAAGFMSRLDAQTMRMKRYQK